MGSRLIYRTVPEKLRSQSLFLDLAVAIGLPDPLCGCELRYQFFEFAVLAGQPVDLPAIAKILKQANTRLRPPDGHFLPFDVLRYLSDGSVQLRAPDRSANDRVQGRSNPLPVKASGLSFGGSLRATVALSDGLPRGGLFSPAKRFDLRFLHLQLRLAEFQNSFGTKNELRHA